MYFRPPADGLYRLRLNQPLNNRWKMRFPRMWLGLCIFLVCGCFSSLAQAASWHLGASQASTSDWNRLVDWWSEPNGTGTHPSSISSSDTFYTNGYLLRSPQTLVNETFGGGTLVLNGGSILNKSKSTTTIVTVANLVSAGGVTRSVDNGITTAKYNIGILGAGR